jgi:hypothetical protein
MRIITMPTFRSSSGRPHEAVKAHSEICARLEAIFDFVD